MEPTTYVIVEPGAQRPPTGGRAFVAHEGESLSALFERVERSAAARGGPSVLHLELGPDASALALDARSRLLGTLAGSLPEGYGRLVLAAPAGRALWMAQALAEWIRRSRGAVPVTVEVIERSAFARAA